ncbi:hypothetical protein [Pseudobutyrivibrio xylanivorans]|uniref:Fibronectin type-III domain-containing protein n=1 Tax=Pseudobutyrivibrio xylanivorans TaxID=185007 RepID=A0A5P6VNT2_PSEXY|nr:hypothetical protein [Pseudobutyrivibrio xylanivorans]QFJ54336.1 hypothetical protein FXF36_05445 [Pseudobutyrivibrio xylanivorans]
MRKKINSLLMLLVLVVLSFSNSSVANAEECFTINGYTFYESDFPLSTDYPDNIYEYYSDPTDPKTYLKFELQPIPYCSDVFYTWIGENWFDQHYTGLNPALAQPWLFARYDVVKKYLERYETYHEEWFYSRVQEKHLGTINPQNLAYIEFIDDDKYFGEVHIYNPNNVSLTTEQPIQQEETKTEQQQTTETSIAQADTQVTEAIETPLNNTYTSSNFTITTDKRKFEATLNEVSKPTYKVIVNGVDINYYLLKTSTSNKFTFTNLQSGCTYNVEARARSNFGDNVYQETLTIKIP